MVIYIFLKKTNILTYKRVSCGPMITTSHLYMSSSSIRPAEKPSTGFLLSSGKKDIRYFLIQWTTKETQAAIGQGHRLRMWILRARVEHVLQMVNRSTTCHRCLQHVCWGPLRFPHFHRVHPAVFPWVLTRLVSKGGPALAPMYSGTAMAFWESSNFLNVASYGNNENHRPWLERLSW